MMDLILLLQADSDIQAAFSRYEDFQPGRGELLLRQLDAALALLRTNPQMAPLYAGPYRRLLMRDFPYGVFYTVYPNRLIIAAVMDLRQEPQRIRKKLLGSQT